MGSIGTSVDIEHLLQRLTLSEKVSLLSACDWWRTPVIKREGVFVPHIKTTDGPNGARGESYVSGIKAACFPSGAGVGATFDQDLAFRIGREVAKEARTKSANILLAPTLNVIRSPLGGRNYETYSEDPHVLGTIAAAYVRGCQSVGVAATPKHFVANEAENGRTTLSVEVDEQTLREIYLRPFQLVMKLSDPWCFMTSYNRVNGTYVSDDSYLVKQVLREEWGFQGLVVSDWMGTYSTVDSINASVDLEMPGPPKWRGEHLLRAVNDGHVKEATINESVRRVLAAAEKLGRFEDPSEAPERAVDNPSRDGFIADAAAEGMVLLKNEGILPFTPQSKVAIIGHHAANASLGGGGSARVDSIRAVTPLQGLQEAGIDTTFAPGVPVFGALPHANPSIVFETDATGTRPCPVRLEWFNGPVIGKRPTYQEQRPNAEYMIKEKWPSYLDQDYCTRMTFDLIPETSGDHIFSVISTGRSKCYINGELVFERIQETDLKLEAFYFFKSKLERRFTHAMEADRRYHIVLDSWATDPEILNAAPLFGKMFQGAALRFHEFIDMPARISDAAKIARTADVAVVCVGTTNEIESEGFDRDTLDLSGAQYDMIAAVAKANPKTVVVNFSGGPINLTQFIDTVPAVLQAWFPGQECGHSVARILTGAINPSGRLPLSWPRRNEDNPSYGNFPVGMDGKLRYEEGLDIGYRYYDHADTPQPLFPFGHGLSYTTFNITNVRCGRADGMTAKRPNGSIEILYDVQNTGNDSGKLVVQCYVALPRIEYGRRRPRKELKNYSKISLEAGEKATVAMILDKYAVSFYDAEQHCWRAKAGTYKCLIGQSCQNIQQEIEFELHEDFTWTGI